MSTFASHIPFTVNGFMIIGEMYDPDIYDLDTTIGNFSSIGQTFTSGNTAFNITDVSIVLKSDGNMGDVTVKLYAADVNGFPTGAILAQGSIADGSIINCPNNAYGSNILWTDITVTDYLLTANTTYVLVVSTTVYGVYPPNRLFVRGAGGYANGIPIAYKVHTAAWETTALIGDFAFQVNGVASPAGYVDITATVGGQGTISGTPYITATPSESFDPPVATGLNAMKSIRRLVALAQNTFYYEDL